MSDHALPAREALARRLCLAECRESVKGTDMVLDPKCEGGACMSPEWRQLLPQADAALAWLSEPAQIEAMDAAYDRALHNPTLKPCERCDGKGYHHGFGGDGRDPDWCTVCGGDGGQLVDEREPIRAAVAALTSERTDG